MSRGLLGSQAHQVEGPTLANQMPPGGQRQDDEYAEETVGGAFEITHHPADHARRGGVVGEVLHEQHAGADREVERHAGQQENRRRRPAGPRGQRHDEPRGGHRAEQGRRGNGELGQATGGPEANHEERHQARACRYAERVRTRERIAQQRLIRRSGQREGPADNRGEQNARQPRNEEDRRCRIAAPVEGVCPDVPEADGSRAERRSENQHGGQRPAGQDQQARTTASGRHAAAHADTSTPNRSVP